MDYITTSLLTTFAFAVILVTLFDVGFFKNRNSTWLPMQLLFVTYENKITKKVYFPAYRIIQLEFICLITYLVYHYHGLTPAIAITIPHLTLSYDLLYYPFVLKEWASLKEYEIKGECPDWLNHPWTLGIIFRLTPFTRWKFILMGLAGLAAGIIVLLNFSPISLALIGIKKFSIATLTTFTAI